MSNETLVEYNCFAIHGLIDSSFDVSERQYELEAKKNISMLLSSGKNTPYEEFDLTIA